MTILGFDRTQFRSDFLLDGIEGGELPFARDLEQFVNWDQGFAAAFPDLEVEEREVFESDAAVAMLVDLRGTHQAEFLGIPASGNRLEIRAVLLHRLDADGRIAHGTIAWDSDTIRRQLDAPPRALQPRAGVTAERSRWAGPAPASDGPYALVERWLEATFPPGDADEAIARARPFLAPDCSKDDTWNPTPYQGADEVLGYMHQWFEFLPDMTVDVKEVFEMEDVTICVLDLSGTHSNEFEGRAPSGKHIVARNIGVYRCDPGCSHIRHITLGYDNRTILDQLDSGEG